MPRRRRPKDPIDHALEIVPALGGLAALCWFYVPGFKQIVGATVIVVLSLAALAALIFLFVRLSRNRKSETDQFLGGTGTSQSAGQASSPPALTLPVRTAPPPVAPRTLTRELLCELEWKRFEEVVEAYVRETGHDARPTRIGADGGVDVEVIDRATGKVVLLIQCKAWDAYKVGIKPVRELFGVMAAAGIKEGALFTTGSFTAEAIAFGQAQNLDLVDGDEFLHRISQLPPAAQSRLLATATTGDYKTPTCPSCGTKMVYRLPKPGSSRPGFWGCSRYPHCRQKPLHVRPPSEHQSQVTTH